VEHHQLHALHVPLPQHPQTGRETRTCAPTRIHLQTNPAHSFRSSYHFQLRKYHHLPCWNVHPPPPCVSSFFSAGQPLVEQAVPPYFSASALSPVVACDSTRSATPYSTGLRMHHLSSLHTRRYACIRALVTAIQIQVRRYLKKPLALGDLVRFLCGSKYYGTLQAHCTYTLSHYNAAS